MQADAPRSRIEQLLERDGQRCVWCGSSPWPRDLSVEHVCPRSRGGIGDHENLALACRRCNRRRRSRSASAFAAERALEGADPDFTRLEAILERLASSTRRPHREYGERELRHLPAARARAAATG